jgi:hypothetical protein
MDPMSTNIAKTGLGSAALGAVTGSFFGPLGMLLFFFLFIYFALRQLDISSVGTLIGLVVGAVAGGTTQYVIEKKHYATCAANLKNAFPDLSFTDIKHFKDLSKKIAAMSKKDKQTASDIIKTDIYSNILSKAV